MTTVSIFGAHYTGKTTLAKRLADRTGLNYQQSDQAVEIAKSLNINSLDDLEKQPIDIKWLFQEKMLESLKSININSITDGNPISCIPYGKKLLNNQLTDTSQGKQIIAESIKCSNNYDYLFYLPIEFEFNNDNFRHSGSEFRIHVAQDLLYNINTQYTVLTGSIEDRIQTAKFIMNLQTKPARHNHIVFEGICNSGKSTILQMIMEQFNKENIPYYNAERKTSPEDNTTEKDLILWYSDLDKYKTELLTSYMNLFSYTSEHHEIDNKLINGEIVFSDRHKFSVIALGLGLGYDLTYMYKLTSHLKTAGTILFFDLPFEEGVRRARLNSKSMPSIRTNSHVQKIMSDGFKKLASIHAEVIVIDATQSKQDLFNNVYEIVSNRIKAD